MRWYHSGQQIASESSGIKLLQPHYIDIVGLMDKHLSTTRTRMQFKMYEMSVFLYVPQAISRITYCK